MSGELLVERIKPYDELIIEGNLKVTGKVIIENPVSFESDDNSVAVKSQIREYVQEIAFEIMPIGTIVPFSGKKDQVPTMWLPCDGIELLIDENNNYYPLYQIIGKQWGGSDTTFRLPDLEGKFLRGVDNGRDVDPDAIERIAIYSEGNTGDSVGSYQDDALQGHSHFMSGIYAVDGSGDGGNTVFNRDGYNSGIYTEYEDIKDPIKCNNEDIDFGEVRLSSETRPQNAAVNFIIKY